MKCHPKCYFLSGQRKETYLSSPEFCLLYNSDIISSPAMVLRLQIHVKETTVTKEKCSLSNGLDKSERQTLEKTALKLVSGSLCQSPLNGVGIKPASAEFNQTGRSFQTFLTLSLN